MEVFVMIKREKTTISLDVKETALVESLKKSLEDILRKSADDLRLIYNTQVMEDNRPVSEYGLTIATTKPHAPASIALVYKNPDGEFEEINITPVSIPRELPENMKRRDSNSGGT